MPKPISAKIKPKERVKLINAILSERYPCPKCALTYNPRKPYQLLIATRLSAQCSDVRVNIVTPPLFKKYKTLKSLANAKLRDVEELIKTCGLYKTKAKSIIGICQELLDDWGGRIPVEMDDLLKLPGVGRKTANLIRGELFGKPAIVADTHVIRLSVRLGLAFAADALKVEEALWKLVPEEESLLFCHRLVLYGREICHSRKPECENCVIKDLCVLNN